MLSSDGDLLIIVLTAGDRLSFVVIVETDIVRLLSGVGIVTGQW